MQKEWNFNIKRIDNGYIVSYRKGTLDCIKFISKKSEILEEIELNVIW